MPKLGETQFHLGGSLHLRDLGNPAATVRYRSRPFAHPTDMRLVDTGEFDAKGEPGMGLAAAAIAGPFHAAGEGYWTTGHRRVSTAPTYFDGDANLGLVLPHSDSRRNK